MRPNKLTRSIFKPNLRNNCLIDNDAIKGASKNFGEWYQKAKQKRIYKLTTLALKMIPILYNTLLATFIKPPENCQERPV
jgi:hypothetical protein